MLVLKTTSPSATGAAPNDRPKNTRPSSRARHAFASINDAVLRAAESSFSVGASRMWDGFENLGCGGSISVGSIDEGSIDDRRQDSTVQRVTVEWSVLAARGEAVHVDRPGGVGVEYD